MSPQCESTVSCDKLRAAHWGMCGDLAGRENDREEIEAKRDEAKEEPGVDLRCRGERGLARRH